MIELRGLLFELVIHVGEEVYDLQLPILLQLLSRNRSQISSGASTRVYKALELMDGGSDYLGKVFLRQSALLSVNTIIGPALVGKGERVYSFQCHMEQPPSPTFGMMPFSDFYSFLQEVNIRIQGFLVVQSYVCLMQ